MDAITQNKLSSKVLMAAGAILVLIVLGLSFIVGGNKNTKQSAVSPTPVVNRQGPTLPPTAIPTYIPPPNFTYTTVDSINFIPRMINDFQVDQDVIVKTTKQLYPTLDGKSLEDAINKDVFEWLALNDHFQKTDPNKVSALYAGKKIANINSIEKDLQNMEADYLKDLISMDGFYLRLRFVGTVQSNLDKLQKQTSQLEPTARQLINQYRTMAMSEKDGVLDKFNNDQTVLLMNNRETSKKFTNHNLYPPLVADVNYYSFMNSLPVGEVSDVITLKTRLNGKGIVQPYAYAVFYISRKTGTNLPLDVLANAYVSKSKIR